MFSIFLVNIPIYNSLNRPFWVCIANNRFYKKDFAVVLPNYPYTNIEKIKIDLNSMMLIFLWLEV
ncbi:MAG: hypothetical protein ACI9DJ_001736 [Algoriphagus sp.]|jgi:hypothetical protein